MKRKRKWKKELTDFCLSLLSLLSFQSNLKVFFREIDLNPSFGLVISFVREEKGNILDFLGIIFSNFLCSFPFWWNYVSFLIWSRESASKSKILFFLGNFLLMLASFGYYPLWVKARVLAPSPLFLISTWIFISIYGFVKWFNFLDIFCHLKERELLLLFNSPNWFLSPKILFSRLWLRESKNGCGI